MLNYPSPNPTILAAQRRQIAAETIMGVLAAEGLQVQINPGDLLIRPTLIWPATEIRGPISEAIYGNIFPVEPAGDFFHYTKLPVFESIVSTGEFRLYSLRKRMQLAWEGEFFTFAGLQGWRGYLDERQHLQLPEDQKSGADLFYTSLTRLTAGNEAYMWDEFADEGRGVRLRLRIGTGGRKDQLRAIQYHRPIEQTLLQTINQALAVDQLPPLLPEASYRMSAYSLPKFLDDETEVRLLHMHSRGQIDTRQNDGSWDYWPVQIGAPNQVADISLIGVEAGPDADLDKVRKIIQASAFAGVVPIQAP
jgi:hypothetical protein